MTETNSRTDIYHYVYSLLEFLLAFDILLNPKDQIPIIITLHPNARHEDELNAIINEY